MERKWMDFDELLIYKGQDYKISDGITIHQPNLDEISRYGEREYYQMIYSLTSVGADLKWQLSEIGVDYTKISDFELFYGLLIKGYTKEQTSIIFGDLDFTKFESYINQLNDEIVLAQVVENEKEIKYKETVIKKLNKFQKLLYKIFKLETTYEVEKIKIEVEKQEIIMDSYTYLLIVEYLRKMHGLKRNNQLPANESTKQILIDDAKDEYLLNKDKEYHSQLLNLISSMVNSEGFKYNHDEVWKLKIYAFMDSVKRISKIKYADLLLQSGYSGYGINFKDIDKKQIDWLGELN
jgi:hypothetical protein